MSEAFERILPYSLAFSEGIDRCRGTTPFNAAENGDNRTCKVTSISYCRRGPRELLHDVTIGTPLGPVGCGTLLGK